MILLPRLFLSLVLISCLSLSLVGQTPNQFFAPLKYRCIGPFRGGRSVCVSGVVGDPLTYYMGTCGGGLWKTQNAGVSWYNISDTYFQTSSVGAIAVAPSNPQIVYCGMGEHAPRGVMTSYGDGVYKSYDAGKTWKKIGLEKTRHISRIIIHPENSDIVYVAAQGALYGPSSERGIYKSVDGGKTWDKILYVNNLTGCSELSIDKSNPMVIYAAMWHHQRTPWQVISGGSGSGLYKTTNGGKTWKMLKKGLPKELGKMAICVSRVNPDKVYALIESDSKKERGGLFVSKNGGIEWSRISDDHRLTQRAWYYIEIFDDPNDEHTLYVLSAKALRSIDGGKTWEPLPHAHGDYHDLWINPNNSKNMIIADDGGGAISFNGGSSWSSQDILPTAQIYRVNADNLFPYQVYGGQQDNSSVAISTLALGSKGITDHDWTPSAGGESAFLAFDPDNPRFVLGGSYLGSINLLDTKTRTTTNIMSAPILYLGRKAMDMKYRFDWNAPIIWSRYETNTYYHGAQYVLRTRDMGTTWEEISPDLTRNNKAQQGYGGGPYTNEAVGAENYGTISYIIESPIEKGVIWTGSNDGLVHLTRDAGKTWKNVTPKGIKECLINSIEPSPHDPGTIYIATTRYKFNDMDPGLFKTTNYGDTWTPINSGIPYGAYTRVIREDPAQKGLLFSGTETGLYVSWDAGNAWSPLQLNLPITPVTDILIKHGDVIVSTAGRSFWILDDLEMLQQYNPKTPVFHIYKPENALLGKWKSPLSRNTESPIPAPLKQGVNPANGMVIYYQLPQLEDSVHITLSIQDDKGNVVRTLSSQEDPHYIKYDGGPKKDDPLPKKEGLNRYVWNLCHATLPGVPYVYIEGSYFGHKVSPGTYVFTLTYADQSVKTKGTVVSHPKIKATTDEYVRYHTFMAKMEETFQTMHNKVNALHETRTQLNYVLHHIFDKKTQSSLKKEGEKLLRKIDAWDDDMVQRKSKAYDDVENYENKFTANYLFLINEASNVYPRINASSINRYDQLTEKWKSLNDRADQLIEHDIPNFSSQLWEAGYGALIYNKD